MNGRRHFGIAVTFLLSLSLLLAACGSSTSGTLPQTPAKNGGTLREGLVTATSLNPAPATLDPALATTVSQRVLAGQLFSGLTSWNSQTFQAVPALADRWTTTDQTHWTFHLRDGAKAADGKPVVAADVKATFDHVLDPGQGSPAAGLLQPTSASGRPVVSVLDPSTVQIYLGRPMAELPLALANPALGIVHVPAGATMPDADNPASATGPFMVQTRDATHLHLVKSPGSAAHLDAIDVQFFGDVASSYQAFTQGNLDWSPIPPEKAEEAGQKYGGQLFKPSLRVVYLAFNVSSPQLADQRFRQAVMHSIDRVQLARTMAEGSTALDGLVPSAVLNGPVSTGVDSGCGEPCALDVPKAKSLLAAAFHNGSPPPLTLDVAAGPPFTNASLKQITDNLAAVGIAVQVHTTAPEQYQAITVNPGRQLFQLSWSAGYPSTGAFLPPLFDSASSSDVSELKSADVDHDLRAAQAQADAGQQLHQYEAVQQRIFDAAAVIPVAQFPVDSVERRTVRSLRPLPAGNFDAAAVWLDQ